MRGVETGKCADEARQCGDHGKDQGERSTKAPPPPSCTRAASPPPRREHVWSVGIGESGRVRGISYSYSVSAVTKKFDVNNYVFTTPPCSDYGHTTQCCCLECCCLRVQCTTAQPRTSIPIPVSSPRVRGCSASGPRASLCTPCVFVCGLELRHASQSYIERASRMNMYAAPSANLPHNGRTTRSGCGCALSAR